jgi:hypothetical protein
MTFQTRTANNDRASLAFHVLTIALVGIFALGALVQIAAQIA